MPNKNLSRRKFLKSSIFDRIDGIKLLSTR